MQCGQTNQTKMRDLLIQLEVIEKVMNQKRKEKDTSTKKDPTANPRKNGKGSEKRRLNGSSDSFRIPRSSEQTSSAIAARITEELTPPTTQVIVIVTKPMVLQIRSMVPKPPFLRKGRTTRTSPTKGAGTNYLSHILLLNLTRSRKSIRS